MEQTKKWFVMNRSPFNNSYNQTTQAQNSYTGYGTEG